jgi:hypothetical protein
MTEGHPSIVGVAVRDLGRLRAEAESQLEILRGEGSESTMQSDFYSYRYFASEGFLPGYSFPRLPLSAWIGELQGFTGREHEINDRVDVLTLALEWWRGHGQPLRFIGGEQRASAAFR